MVEKEVIAEMEQIAIVNGSVYRDHKFHNENVYISSGKISRITEEILPAEKTIDASDMFVIPGLIDPHVHMAMNELSADDFASGSIAAVHGGVTTIIDFLDEATTAADVSRLFQARQKLASDVHTDYAFHAAVKELEDTPDAIASAALELGMPTIKLYTTYKEMGSYSSPQTVEAMIRRSAQGDIMILCHSEKDELLDLTNKDISVHSKNRPVKSEVEQVRDIAKWVRQYNGQAYIVHTSCGTTVEMLQEEYSDILGSRLFLEGCPQYFLFTDEVYAGPDAVLYTCTPPIRPAGEKQLLTENWHRINSFATDHCPFPKKEKMKDNLREIPMGCGGVEHSFSVLHPLFGDEIIDRFTENTARLHGLYPQKGVLKPGSDADITIYRKNSNPQIMNHSAADYSIYDNVARDIEIVSVLIRGSLVIEEGQFKPFKGKYIERSLK